MTLADPLPATMRAMAIAGFDGPEAIGACTLGVPTPGAGEVLVRIAAAAVNPADWKACAGYLPFLAGTFPLVPGFDGSGTVVALGGDPGALKIGDRISFMSSLPLGRGGTWSEYAICQANHAVRLPDELSFAEAATIPVAGISAREALSQGGLAAGQRVLVNGGSGGTGIWGIQIARACGAHVAATAGSANQDLLRALGAECSIDYRKDDLAASIAAWAPDGVDLLLDTVGQGSIADPASLIRPGGRYVAIETMLPHETLPDAKAFAARNITAMRTSADFARLGMHLSALVEALSRGTMTAPPLEIVPMSQAAAALARVCDGHVRGKIVLAVEQDQDVAAKAAATVEDLT